MYASLYLVRFRDIRFATSAVTALVHDVLVVLAFYAVSPHYGREHVYCVYADHCRIFDQCNHCYFDRIREDGKSRGKGRTLQSLSTDVLR